ncbi:MAG: cation:proton antiporter [Burkholderiales bacterium]|nr:cation:proton antiporter [Burkholderiales bacterium]
MSHAADIPALSALVTALLVLAGAALALIGSIGLLRLKTFYERVHAPTMGTTLGMGLVLIASTVLFSVLESRPVLHEMLIAAFMTLTTPVTFLLLVRAARRRQQTVGDTSSVQHSSGEPR